MAVHPFASDDNQVQRHHGDAVLTHEAGVLRQAIQAASTIAIFTGAGLSTECGVPDFRSPGSPWMENKPIPFQEFCADPAVRVEAWRRKFIMDDHAAGARPGRGHHALAQLVAAGHAHGVITQNIDGLHQASGLSAAEVIELHGNGTYATCLDCGKRHELSAIRESFVPPLSAPQCVKCEGPVKSATISFGQAMPKEALVQAMAWARQADLFLAIGSSLVVNPAARLPRLAKEHGARLIIINREPTPLDSLAENCLRSDIGPLLNAACQPL
jgi:NAD-dependent deacetylase